MRNTATAAAILALVAAACGPAAEGGEAGEWGEGAAEAGAVVRPGVDVLLDDVPAALRGVRVGLITNHTGRDAAGTSTIDRLHGSDALDLVALYSPEHGIRGVAAPGEQIASGHDDRTGLPIHSLYGETRRPTPAMLEGVEALFFDIQDVGTRHYTYISTMKYGMEAAAEQGIPFVVLDRPNPIGGHIVEGNILEREHETFIGIHQIPVRHGMTVGELARMFDADDDIGAELIVIPADGWRRDMWWDETGLEWVNPSPNIRRLEAAIHYPGTVFLEATNLSEGRGTEMPFEQTGAPWLRAAEVADSMNALGLDGVRFETVTIPVEEDAARYPGQSIPGVRLVLTDRETYRPVEATLRMLDVIQRLHPEFEWRSYGGVTLARHGGTARLIEAYRRGTLDALLGDWRGQSEEFMRLRQPYLIYE